MNKHLSITVGRTENLHAPPTTTFANAAGQDTDTSTS